MASRLVELFEDDRLAGKIRKKLPYLFQLAEMEASRAGKLGMEVGSLRERILISLLIYKFGRSNVETEIPITEADIDTRLFGEPISIKSITGMGGVKVVWTVDAKKAREFAESYRPRHDILLAQIEWDKVGGLYYVPTEVQRGIFHAMGRENYLKLPKAGTNPRGVEISKEGLVKLVGDPGSKVIKICWLRSNLSYDAYQKWVEHWEGD